MLDYLISYILDLLEKSESKYNGDLGVESIDVLRFYLGEISAYRRCLSLLRSLEEDD